MAFEKFDAEIVGAANFEVSQWAGGSTTQLLIEPCGADFRARDFDFRISSATFSITESEFSDFSGYRRFLLPLRGEIALRHEGQYDRKLAPYEVEVFDGSWKTYSHCSADCIDFNLIVRGGIDADMRMLKIGQRVRCVLGGGHCVCLYSERGFVVRAMSQCTESKDYAVAGGEMLVLRAVSGDCDRAVSGGGAVYIEISDAESEVVLCVVRGRIDDGEEK